MKLPFITAALLASIFSLSHAQTDIGVAVSGVTIPAASSICKFIRCPGDTTCIETQKGAECVPVLPPPKPNSCAVILCAEGESCVDSDNGGQCVPSTSVPPTNPPLDGCLCTLEYAPVCCRFKSGELKTVGNGCACTGCNSGNTIVTLSACEAVTCETVDCAAGFECVEEDGSAKCVEIESCVCPAFFDPVCCFSETGIVTKSNSCFCTCEPSGRILFKGNCPSVGQK